MRSSFETPILFIIFNRLDTVKIVFEKIRLCKPAQLFIASDGPRGNRFGEKETVESIRDYVLNNVDWECEVKTLFSEKNMGCDPAISMAISWFFSYIKQGIILEDDCLPDLSFFSFCEQMLNYYSDNEKVFEITGCNLQGGIIRGNGSYYFSNYGGTWGWATWRRAWEKFNYQVTGFNKLKEEKDIQSVFEDRVQQRYWINFLKKEGNTDTWDYQWLYTIWYNKGICIVPNSNLITNIGFNLSGTHTLKKPDWYDKATSNNKGLFDTVKHPAEIKICIKADDLQFYTSMYAGSLLKRTIHFIKRRLIKDNA